MVNDGKTLKGLTDATLGWQTERFLELETRREGITVFVRPEQVVEIALDGVQTSTRYPGGHPSGDSSTGVPEIRSGRAQTPSVQ